MLVPHQRRQQIFDDAPQPGLDLDRHRHTGRQVDQLVLDLHLRAVERDAGGVEQFLPLRLAGLGERAGVPRVSRVCEKIRVSWRM